MIDLRDAQAEKSLAWVGEQHARMAAFVADNFESDANLIIAGMTVTGVISLHWANVRGDLRLTSSHLMPQAGQAVAGRDVRVGRTLFMDGPDFHAEGEISLRPAHVKGDLNCRHARFDNPSGGGEGLNACGMEIGGCLTWMLDPPPEGLTDMSRAQISRLDDTEGSWKEGKYTLTGMSYQRVGDHLALPQRRTWLLKTASYSSDAYRQLAQVYRQGGQEADAPKILIASQRDMRSKSSGQLPRRSRAWSWFIDRFAGYGYKLHRPFVALLVVGLVGGGVVFLIAQHFNLIVATGQPHHVSALEAPPPGYAPFYPFPYAFQLLVPGLDLREATYWLPDAAKNGWGLFMMVFARMLIVFGWVLATAVVAGITRLFRQRT